ncbi:MAG TPA: alpha/beta hydrolase [Gammaproteobacteria bacterium]|nr:alpha/beta hydrolase [Gammaproteobacteria bacterium]
MNTTIAKSVVAIMLMVMAGCTKIQRLAYMYSDEALKPNIHRYQDGGESIYYTFNTGNRAASETFIFFYGGTGCPSWKSVMPGYVDGLSVPANVHVLNKRFVSDRSTGMFGCGKRFHEYNNIEQWVSDYSDFVLTQIKKAERPPKNVVLVGVSEGAVPAVRVAAKLPVVTHLAIIGGGGYTMRTALKTLYKKGSIFFDVDEGWKKIKAKPDSIDDTWYGNTYRWWSEIMDYDPMPYFLRLDIPVLVGMGEDDTSVPVESAYYLKSVFARTGKRNLVLKVYPGADHRLNGEGISYRQEFFSLLGRML